MEVTGTEVTGVATLLAVVAGFLFQLIQTGRQRKWDVEDRIARDQKVIDEAKVLADKVIESAQEVATKTDETNKKTDIILEKADEIHLLTNSNLAAVKAELALQVAASAVLMEQVKGLQALVSSLIDERSAPKQPIK